MNICSSYHDSMSERHRLDPADIYVAAEVASIMRALATPSRVQILGRLVASPATVTELVRALEMEQSAISHQLQALRHLGLVVGERRGRHIIYSLHDPHVTDLLRQAVSHVEHRRLALRSHDVPKATAA
jgi:DNA-binding transcriptional ArsR family regulator